MSRVVAAVDDSAATVPVLAVARALAPVLGATVEAVQVISETAGRTAKASADASGVPFRAVAGDPVEVLAGIASDDDVVACVLGARGSPGGARPVGHVALALADRIDKPVVVVPPELPADRPLRRVVIAMEGGPGMPRTLRRAVDIAAGTGLELVVVHVDDEGSIPPFADQVQYDTESYAREFLARYCRGAPQAQLELRIGMPADEVLRAVDELAADLLAIGWPQRAEPGHGEVAREILDRARIPVILVATR